MQIANYQSHFLPETDNSIIIRDNNMVIDCLTLVSGKSPGTKVLQGVAFTNPSLKAGVSQNHVLHGL